MKLSLRDLGRNRSTLTGVVLGAMLLGLVPVVGAVWSAAAPLISPVDACSGSTNTIFFKGYDPDTLSTHYTNNQVISVDRDTTQSFNAACSGRTYWYLLGTNDGDWYNTSGKYGNAYRFSSSGDSYTGTQFTALAYDTLSHAGSPNDGIHNYYTHVDRCTGQVTSNPTGFQSQADGSGHYSIWGWMFTHSAGTCDPIGTGDAPRQRLDRVVPTMAISALNGGGTGLCNPTCGSPLPTTSTTFSLSYSANDPNSGNGYHSGLHSVDADTNGYVRWFWSDGHGWQLCGTTTNPGTSANQQTVTGTVNCTLPAVENLYSITAVSQDLGGNCSDAGYISSGICFASGSAPVKARVIYDVTSPTATITAPTGSQTRWNPAVDITWTESDGAVGSGVQSRSLQRQVNSLSTCAGTWSNDGSALNAPSPVTQTVLNGSCYRWLLTITDAAGNNSAQQTSGTVTRDSTLGLGRQGYQRFETWDLGSGDSLAASVATGNANLAHPLVTLPIRGSSISLGLVYNSQDSLNIGDGPGWRLNVQRRLTLNGDATVTLIDGTGARHTFTNPQTVGTVTTYTRPATLYGTLVKDTSQAAQFTLTYRDQSRDRFTILNAEALLTRQEDRFGNGADIAYTSGTTRMSTITDPTARTITFTWDGSNRLASIADWAYIDGSGVVQTTNTGSRRTYRFFYDGSSNLIGWADPLNTSGSCPTNASHLTCLTYASGQLTGISKTQSVETAGTSALTTTPRLITTVLTYVGSDIGTVKDAEQNFLGGPATGFTRTAGEADVTVARPTTTTRYHFTAATDAYLRVQSIFRHDTEDGVDLEQRTVYDTTYPIESASVTDNYGGLVNAPAHTSTFTYVASSLGLVLKVVEPLTASPATNRWNEYTYNANNDVLTKTVSLDGSATRTVTKLCYSADCTTNTGLTLLKQIENYVSAGAQNSDTNVTNEFTYDSYGQRTRAIRHNRDGGGGVRDDRITGFTYDSYGNLTAQIANYVDGVVSAGGDDITPNATTQARTDLTTAYTYDTAANRVSAADPRRAILAATGSPGPDDYVSRWTFDALNEPITDTRPTTPGLTTTCPPGNPSCRTSSSAFDELGPAREHTDYSGVVAGTAYDRDARAIQTFEDTDGAGLGAPATTSGNTYDADGRLLTAKDRRQVGSSSLGYMNHHYDSLGREDTVTDAFASSPDVSSATISVYDGLDRKLILNVAGQSTTSVYDLGRRTTSSDDGFTCTTTTFDYRDLTTAITDGLVGGTCASGANTRTVTNSIDGLGRQYRAQVTAGADSGDRTQDDVLDAIGDQLSAATLKGTATTSSVFTVNLLDQTMTEVRTDASAAVTTAKTTYDAANNATDKCAWKAGITVGGCYPVGTTPWPNPPSQNTTTSYDATDQRVTLADGLTNATTTYDPAYNYQVAAVYNPTASGKEFQSLYTYDVRHRLSTVTHLLCVISSGHNCSSTTSMGSDTYQYDDNDNRTQVTESIGGATTNTYYCYDARNQLTAAKAGSSCTSSPTETYAYDGAGTGNRTQKVVGGQTTNYAYYPSSDPAHPNQLCAVGSTNCASPNVTYDSAGRILTYNGWWFDYDSRGRLIKACAGDSSCSSPDQAAFAYDGEDHLIQVFQSVFQSQTTTDYRYQGNDLVQESVGGTVTRSYVTDDSGRIVKVCDPDCSSGTVYLVTWNGHGDALGLWRQNVDGTVTLATSYTYDSWGTPTGVGGPGLRFLYLGASAVQFVNPDGLGLYYMHARFYSPALGRFLQPDPARVDENNYAYANNSPVSAADPSGTFWYRVRRGDSLWSLAERYLGSGYVAWKIVHAWQNRDRISQRRARLWPGQCIWIPVGAIRRPHGCGWANTRDRSSVPEAVVVGAATATTIHRASRVPDVYGPMRCAAAGWGGAALIGVAGEVALGAPEAFAIGGTIAVLSGVGLVVIGGIGIGVGVFVWIQGCS